MHTALSTCWLTAATSRDQNNRLVLVWSISGHIYSTRCQSHVARQREQPYTGLRWRNLYLLCTTLTSSASLIPRSAAFAVTVSVGRDSFAQNPVNPRRTPKARQLDTSARAADLETKGMVMGARWWRRMLERGWTFTSTLLPGLLQCLARVWLLLLCCRGGVWLRGNAHHLQLGYSLAVLSHSKSNHTFHLCLLMWSVLHVSARPPVALHLTMSGVGYFRVVVNPIWGNFWVLYFIFEAWKGRRKQSMEAQDMCTCMYKLEFSCWSD